MFETSPMIINEAISLGKRNLVDSIYKSAKVEGLGITFPDTHAIIENAPVYAKPSDILYVCNMKRAWEFLFENIDYPLILPFLRELNKISMEYMTSDAGSIRTYSVSIGGTSWKPEIPIESAISEKLRQLSSIEDKFDAALENYCYITRCQMFQDGNKRLANLTTNKILMENDLGIFSVPVEKDVEHVKLLVDFYETNDNKTLKEFLREECITPTKKLIEQLESNKGEDIEL